MKIVNICDKLILGALILLIFLVPLAQTASTYAVNEPIKLMFLRIITVLIMALWLVRAAESRELSLRRTPLDLPLLAFVSIAVLATLLSIDPYLSFWGQLYRYEGLVTVTSYVFIYYVTVNFVKLRRERNLLLGTVLLVSGLVAVYAVLQHFGIDFITWDSEMMDVSRSIATFGNSVFLGAYLTLVLPVAIVYALYFPGQSTDKRVLVRGRARSTQHNLPDGSQVDRASSATTEDENEKLDTRRSESGTENQEPGTMHQVPDFVAPLLRIVSVLLVPLLIAALVFSYTRAAWLGSLGAIFFIVLFSFREIRKQKRIVAFTIAVLMIVAVVFSFAILRSDIGMERSLTERIQSVFKVGEGSAASRLVLWNTSLQVIKARPLLGFGLDTYALTFQKYQPADWYKVIRENALPDKTHNEMLQITATMGLLGLLASLWVLLTFFFRGFVALRKAPASLRTVLVGLMAAAVGYLVQIQFSFSIISVAPIFWLLLGLAVLEMETGEVRSVNFGVFKKGMPALFRVVFYPSLVIVAGFLLISAVKPFLADQHVRKAWARQAFNFWDEAARELEQAVRLNPGEVRYSIRLGETYLMKYRTTREVSNRDKAFAALESARSISPGYENIYFYLGGLYVEMGKTSPRYFDKAIASYRKVLELSPNDVDAHFDLGIAYANRGKHDLAIKEWKRAVFLDPKFTPAYLVLGRAYELRNEWKAAEKVYRKALEIDGNNIYAKKGLESLKNR